MDETTLTRLIAGLRSGNPSDITDFWNHYGPMMTRMAEKNLAAGVKRRVGADDVVQSVCRTFFRRAQGGEFQFDNSDDIWRLLCAITLTKVREKTRFHMRQKRGLQNEVALEPGTDSARSLGPADAGPSPADEAEFADLLQSTLDSLSEEERQIVDLRLQDMTMEDIAKQLGCSERTVRRIMKRVQATFEKALTGD